MQKKDEKITFRLPADIKKQVEEVAQRYDMTLSNATLFLLSCGLDTEKDYRPVLYVAHKMAGFAEKLKDGETYGKSETATN